MNPFFEIKIWEIELRIAAYALFACIGLFFFMMLVYVRIERLNISFRKFLVLILFLVIGVGIGSKLFFILTKTGDVIKNFSITYLLRTIATSGFVFYGGLFGAIIGMWIYSKIFKISFPTLANIITPGFSMFHAFGRIGCFFAGCCYGKIASWGFALENEPEVLRIPVQLIESVILILLTIFLLIVDKKFQDKIMLLPIYLIIYAICRFILEIYRGDEIRGIFIGLSTSQWISVFVILGVCVLLIKNNKSIITSSIIISKIKHKA